MVSCGTALRCRLTVGLRQSTLSVPLETCPSSIAPLQAVLAICIVIIYLGKIYDDDDDDNASSVKKISLYATLT